jgi:hypothetical protein
MLWLVKKNQGERKMSVFRGFKYLVLIGLIFLASWALAEETGKIAGKVADAKTGERCPFTLVTIIGTKIGVNADENGNFVIDNLPEGSYDVKAKMIGYKDSEKDNVLVIQGKTTVQDFALDRSTIWPPLPPPGPGKSETVVIPIGSIKGKVTDSNKSEGLHNALVEIVGKKLLNLRM